MKRDDKKKEITKYDEMNKSDRERDNKKEKKHPKGRECKEMR